MSNQAMFAALAVYGLASAAAAQDSVGQRSGLACTDAVRAHDTAEQHNAYINYLTSITSTLERRWGITPLAKTSRSSAAMPNSFVRSVALSSTSEMLEQPPFLRYRFWVTAGRGVNSSIVGNPPAPANLPAPEVLFQTKSFQMGWGVSDFGTSDAGLRYNGIEGGCINIGPANPNRLFVTRLQAAVNGLDNEDRSQLGLGSVGREGFVYFRADGVGSGTPPVLQGHNYFRIRTSERFQPTLHIIDNNGASGISSPLDGAWFTPRRVTVPLTVPNCIAVGGGSEVLLGSNFGNEYLYENVAHSFTATTAHRPGAQSHRGAVAYSHHPYFEPGPRGTAAIITQQTNQARSINLWGIVADGGVGATHQIVLPANLTDRCNNVNFLVEQSHQFDHFRSQTSARGGVQVAIGKDRENRFLAAAYVGAFPAGPNAAWPFGYIAGARLNTPIAPADWGVAAYVLDAGAGGVNGTPFHNIGGEQIGRLTVLADVTGGAPAGPSISAPAMDSAGNIWFLAAYVLTDLQGIVTPGSASIGLFRAVYDGGSTDAPEWCLERVLAMGQVIRGANSDRNYKIASLSISDGDSVASDSLWANSINQSAWMDAPLDLDPADPRTLGGLVVACSLIYDVNQDGQFIPLTGVGGDPASQDQDYNAVLFIGPFTPPGPITDCNGNGIDDVQDIKVGTSRDCFDFAAPPIGGRFVRGGANGIPDECECVADWDRNGVANSTDVSEFINSYFADKFTDFADIDCNGVTNSTDVSEFINLYFAAQAGQLPLAGCAI